MPRKDSQSVTNALLDTKLTTLTETVNTLAETVNRGFIETHRKQDYTNGRVGTQEQEIIKLQERFRLGNALWFVVTILVGMLVWTYK